MRFNGPVIKKRTLQGFLLWTSGLLTGILVCSSTLKGQTSLPASPLPITLNTDSAKNHLNDPFFTVFLIGDTGDPYSPDNTTNFDELRRQLLEAGANSAVIFLGDNIYPHGMPDSGDVTRPEAEKRIIASLEIVKNYPGKVVWIPGNHDWDESGKRGLDFIINEQDFISGYMGRDDVFFPSDGCPGPVEVNLNQNEVLILLDTQWFLHPWEKPQGAGSCGFKNVSDIFQQLDDIMERNKHKIIMVAAHHPMYTYGRHNGYSTWKTNIFPLTDLNKDLYIPLPGLAQVYTAYRRIIGSLQDTHNPEYQQMQQQITRVLRKYPNTLYLNGHEHVLQYVYRDSVHYITSGAGSKSSALRAGKYTRFAAEARGFARLDESGDGTVSLKYFEPAEHGPGAVYFRELFTKKPCYKPDELFHNPVRNGGDFITTHLTDMYVAGQTKQFLLGKNYRHDFTEPVSMPVFDIGSVSGGLKILQLGGGNQSKSLRLADSSGREYVMRLVNKDPSVLVPDFLKGTVAQAVVQDQMSALEPFGPSIIPPLAAAMQVPHASPILYYIPDDPRFGIYRGRFAGTVGYLEEREPGSSPDEKSYTTVKLLKHLDNDNDYSIDQPAVLKARYLDLIIGDWDRHDDQWRWTGTPVKGGIRYHPVPRDRDMAFFVNEGLVPRLLGADYFVPEIQGFGKKIKDISTLFTDAQLFDRSFLNELSEFQWLQTARETQAALTDAVIEGAVSKLPPPVYKRDGPLIIEKLKRRRDDLLIYALQYYRFLARDVDIVGTRKREYFQVNRLNDSLTRIRVYKIHKADDTSKLIYDRIFSRYITREVRLYGQNGDDIFRIEGNVPHALLIRVIGGAGNDSIADRSRVTGAPFSKTRVYDTPGGNRLDLGNEGTDHTSSRADINRYERRDFPYYYDTFFPQLSFAYNPDDGIFIGGGFRYKTNGFRKEPFSTLQTLTGNYAVATNAYNFNYKGEFTDLIDKADLQITMSLKAPNYVTNFYGSGNASHYDKLRGLDYYRVRFNEFHAATILKFKVTDQIFLYAGPQFDRVRVQGNPGRFINDFGRNGLDSGATFKPEHYAGFRVAYSLDTRHRPSISPSGIYWHTEYNLWKGTSKLSSNYGNLTSAFSLFYSVRLPQQLTLATRFGGELTFGQPAFYQQASLGELTNLRGFRRNRFSGRQDAYNNSEIRLELFHIRNYLLPASFGILAFNDIGKVWYPGKNSSLWHQAFGPGVYISPYNQLVLSANYGISKDDHLLLLTSGFFF